MSGAGWPGGIRDHYGVGSQGLFKSVLLPLGALFRSRVLSVSALPSRALFQLVSSRAIGALQVVPVFIPLHPSERSRLVPAPSSFFPPLRGLFFAIFFLYSFELVSCDLSTLILSVFFGIFRVFIRSYSKCLPALPLPAVSGVLPPRPPRSLVL